MGSDRGGGIISLMRGFTSPNGLGPPGDVGTRTVARCFVSCCSRFRTLPCRFLRIWMCILNAKSLSPRRIEDSRTPFPTKGSRTGFWRRGLWGSLTLCRCSLLVRNICCYCALLFRIAAEHVEALLVPGPLPPGLLAPTDSPAVYGRRRRHLLGGAPPLQRISDIHTVRIRSLLQVKVVIPRPPAYVQPEAADAEQGAQDQKGDGDADDGVARQRLPVDGVAEAAA
ncbi:hypothetical protein BJ166DRAFT_544381 [Pestalotiopsis sp. NC0098]|nr:hypothetical protein BJ166DRAFT_544381 [Pestalotiopsis sp. NC0098]